MNSSFEKFIRREYGNRYDLTRDIQGAYAREVVKRMFETWCFCRRFHETNS